MALTREVEQSARRYAEAFLRLVEDPGHAHAQGVDFTHPELDALQKELARLHRVSQQEADRVYAEAASGFQRGKVNLGLGTLGGLAALVLIAWVLRREVYGAVLRCKAFATTLADGNLATRMPVLAQDEFGRLAWELNRMADTLEVAQIKAAQAKESLQAEIDIQRATAAELRESERRFSTLAGTIEDVFWMAPPDYQSLVYISPAYEKIWGRKIEELRADPELWIKAIHPEDVGPVLEALGALAHGTIYDVEFRILRPDGSTRWIRDRGYPIFDALGEVVLTAGLCTDITSKKGTLQALAEAKETLELRVAERSAELERALRTNRHYTTQIEEANAMAGMLQSCGNPLEALEVVRAFGPKIFPGTQGFVYLHSDLGDLLELAAHWGIVLENGTTLDPSECWALRRNATFLYPGGETALACPHHFRDSRAPSVCAPLLAQGEIIGLLHLEFPDGVEAQETERTAPRLATFSDQVALALGNIRLRQSLRELSIRDALTGLFNRRYMDETLERELFRAVRTKKPLGVIMLDIDYFKRFNDTFGHEAGDEVLRRLGAFLREAVRGEDLACRYGGEELVVLLPDAPLASARETAERIRAGIERLTLSLGGQPLGTVTVSLGVAAHPDHGARADALLSFADRGLYLAKEKGRNRVEVAPD